MPRLPAARNFPGATRHDYFTCSLTNFRLLIVATIIRDTPARQTSVLVQAAALRRSLLPGEIRPGRFPWIVEAAGRRQDGPYPWQALQYAQHGKHEPAFARCPPVLLVNRYLPGAPEVRLATLVDHGNPNEPGPADHYMDRGHAILEQ